MKFGRLAIKTSTSEQFPTPEQKFRMLAKGNGTPLFVSVQNTSLQLSNF